VLEPREPLQPARQVQVPVPEQLHRRGQQEGTDDRRVDQDRRRQSDAELTGLQRGSRRGIFAYITDAEAKDWQSSIDIVLRRFTEYHEGAFGRRAMTERAKGILMERHSVDKEATFEIAA
jgi:hypothetical protein